FSAVSMGPGEIAPAEAPAPSAWNLPFQAAAGGIHTSKPMRESSVGLATPTIRHIGTSTRVSPTLVLVSSYSAVRTRMPGAMVLPVSARQLAASPVPFMSAGACPAGAATLRTGSRLKTETNAFRRDARSMNPSQANWDDPPPLSKNGQDGLV